MFNNSRATFLKKFRHCLRSQPHIFIFYPYGDTILAILTGKYQEIGCRVPDLQLLFYFALFAHSSENLQVQK